MTSPGRIATIDIGTNTVLLLVAERTPDGSLHAVEEHATITRLGQGVDRTRELHQEAIARTRACLDDYGAIVTRLGVTRIDVVGTSAMRDARGSEAITEHIRKTFGVELRVIGGDEEAELTFAGALVGLREAAAGRDGRELVVFDIGGGSTEVVRGRLDDAGAVRSIDYKKSFDVGSVRLTERHVRSDPPSQAELEAVRTDLRATFAELRGLPPAEAIVPIGIAGTMTTLAAVAMKMARYDAGRVHGSHLATRELRDVVEHLASLPLASRREVIGLEPKRADVIVAGGLIALALLEHWGAESTVISDRGVRWGLAVALSRSAATL